jgi:hypothetical protein
MRLSASRSGWGAKQHNRRRPKRCESVTFTSLTLFRWDQADHAFISFPWAEVSETCDVGACASERQLVRVTWAAGGGLAKHRFDYAGNLGRAGGLCGDWLTTAVTFPWCERRLNFDPMCRCSP